MTIFGIIKRIRKETYLEVTLDNGELKFESMDENIIPFCAFTTYGMIVGSGSGVLTKKALISWEEIEFLKKGFTR